MIFTQNYVDIGETFGLYHIIISVKDLRFILKWTKKIVDYFRRGTINITELRQLCNLVSVVVIYFFKLSCRVCSCFSNDGHISN